MRLNWKKAGTETIYRELPDNFRLPGFFFNRTAFYYMLLTFKKILLSKSVARNILANYSTSITAILLATLFTPIYIGYLGIEAFGIIGFINSLLIFIGFLDLGIGSSINREMARHYKTASQSVYIYQLTNALQIIYIAIGIFSALIFIGLSPFLATEWFNAKNTDIATVKYAFIILSITIACRWPYSFFSSTLRGMQLQVLLNVHEIFWSVMRFVGCWVLLKYFNANLISFLWYQCIIIALQTTGSFFLTWYFLPSVKNTPRFNFKVVRSIAGFAGSMGVGAILVAFIFETDKLVLSNILPGPQYGYYMFSVGLAVLVYNISMPICMAVFPHFTRFFHDNKMNLLEQDFHKYTRILAVLLIPFSLILFTFTKEILWLWTKNEAIVTNTVNLIRIMLAGTVLHAFMAVPHVLLLAMGKTKFIIRSHAVALCLIVPLTIFLSTHYGAKGGAIGYAVIFGGYFIVQAPLIIKFYLPGNIIKWYWNDILRIALPLILFICSVLFLMPGKFYSGKAGLIFIPCLGIILLLMAHKLSRLHLLQHVFTNLKHKSK